MLRKHFADRKRVLEIGSGTGQHAVYFGEKFPNLIWQTSDRAENHPDICAWLDDAQLSNVLSPLVLDVAGGSWPAQRYDAVFSANTLHIMSRDEVEAFFAALPLATTTDAKLVIYGPFNYAGEFTSASNAAFDASLKERVPHMGIRDFEAVDALAHTAGFTLIDDSEMPANNRCLVWARQPENR